VFSGIARAVKGFPFSLGLKKIEDVIVLSIPRLTALTGAYLNKFFGSGFPIRVSA
jgi:hypothetical protein